MIDWRLRRSIEGTKGCVAFLRTRSPGLRRDQRRGQISNACFCFASLCCKTKIVVLTKMASEWYEGPNSIYFGDTYGQPTVLAGARNQAIPALCTVTFGQQLTYIVLSRVGGGTHLTTAKCPTVAIR